tara:strand:+ start:38 stop:373 length:336 start_codon:yes stop_codon:yes gene_type:complete
MINLKTKERLKPTTLDAKAVNIPLIKPFTDEDNEPGLVSNCDRASKIPKNVPSMPIETSNGGNFVDTSSLSSNEIAFVYCIKPKMSVTNITNTKICKMGSSRSLCMISIII